MSSCLTASHCCYNQPPRCQVLKLFLDFEFQLIKIKGFKRIFELQCHRALWCLSVHSSVSGQVSWCPAGRRVSRSQTLGVTIPVFRSMNPGPSTSTSTSTASRQLCTFFASKSPSSAHITLVVILSNEISDCEILVQWGSIAPSKYHIS